jgi:hypothetical protein
MMTAPSNWKQEYQLLSDFIAAHSEIVITTNEISIPQLQRDEFYRQFDNVRRALVADHFATLPIEIEMLCENYPRIEKEIRDLLGLDSILMPVDLSSFLFTPKEGLIRAVYNRMFDLLQSKIPFENFETMAGDDLKAAAANLYRLGYERWAALALIKLLDPDEAFAIELGEDDKPCLGELKNINFGCQAHHPTIRIPEFVLHSRKVGKYVTLKMALAREIDGYVVQSKPRVRPKNRTGDTSQVLDSRSMLLSFISNPKEDIPVIAEIFECTRTSPDWLIEFIGCEELDSPQSLNQVQQHVEAMNPKQGTGLILVGSVGESWQEKIPKYIHAIAAGFDQSKLLSFIDTLFSSPEALDRGTT